MSNVRVATVKATGRRYLVDRIHFGSKANDPSKVFCWGEVTKVESVRGALRSTHEGGICKTFLAEAVDVAEVPRTAELLNALFEQHLEVRRGQGHVLVPTRSGRTVRDLGTPEQIAARREAGARLRTCLEEAGLAEALRFAGAART